MKLTEGKHNFREEERIFRLILGFVFREGFCLLPISKLQRYSANVQLPAHLHCSTKSPDLSLNVFSGRAGSSAENLREVSTTARN